MAVPIAATSRVPGAVVEATSSAHGERERWVDTLRVAVIATVIVVHVVHTYLAPFDWYYQERTTSELWAMLLSFPTVIGGIFGLGPLFLVAGWLSARSLARRGRGAFVRARLLRLGAPLIVFVMLIDPLADYIGDVGEGLAGPFPAYFHPDSTGPMWFVAALLAFSVAYAGLPSSRAEATSPRTLRQGVVVVAVAAIAFGSLAVWQVSPFFADSYLDLYFANWPQGAVLFALGVHAGETGWMTGLRPALVRRLGWIAAGGMVALLALLAVALAVGQFEALLSGFGWPTILLAVLDGMIAVCGTLWLVAWVRDRWSSQGALLAMAGRASYATYFAHPLVLTILAVLLAPIALAPELKFVIVAPIGVAVSFAVGFALIRVPGISRLL